MSYNICNEIRCPYSAPDGCSRYLVAVHCHLLYPGEPGVTREGLEYDQRWLYAEENDPRIDINQLKQENQRWLESDETTQNLIEFKRRHSGETV